MIYSEQNDNKTSRNAKRAINLLSDHDMADRDSMSLQQLTNTTMKKRNVPPIICSSLENLQKHYDAEVKKTPSYVLRLWGVYLLKKKHL